MTSSQCPGTGWYLRRPCCTGSINISDILYPASPADDEPWTPRTWASHAARTLFRISSSVGPPEIERDGKFRIYIARGRDHWPRRVTKTKESSHPSSLSFIGVHRVRFITTSTRMRYVITTSTDRTRHFHIDDIKHKRRVDRNRGMETTRRLPRTVSDTTNEIAMRSRRMQRQTPPVASNGVAFTHQTSHAYLKTFDG